MQTFIEWQTTLSDSERDAVVALGAQEAQRAIAAGILGPDGDYAFTSDEQRTAFLAGQNPAFTAFWNRYLVSVAS